MKGSIQEKHLKMYLVRIIMLNADSRENQDKYTVMRERIEYDQAVNQRKVAQGKKKIIGRFQCTYLRTGLGKSSAEHGLMKAE